MAVTARRAALFASDPVWAESMRKRQREYSREYYKGRKGA